MEYFRTSFITKIISMMKSMLMKLLVFKAKLLIYVSAISMNVINIRKRELPNVSSRKRSLAWFFDQPRIREM